MFERYALQIPGLRMAKETGGITLLGQSHLGRKDFDKAIKCFEIGVECNEAESFLELGLIYQAGDKEKKDLIKAAYYYQQAYAKGLERAKELINQMGCVPLAGFNVLRSGPTPLTWYEKGCFYSESDPDTQKKALTCYMTGALIDDNKKIQAQSYQKLAKIFESGIGVSIDLEQAGLCWDRVVELNQTPDTLKEASYFYFSHNELVKLRDYLELEMMSGSTLAAQRLSICHSSDDYLIDYLEEPVLFKQRLDELKIQCVEKPLFYYLRMLDIQRTFILLKNNYIDKIINEIQLKPDSPEWINCKTYVKAITAFDDNNLNEAIHFFDSIKTNDENFAARVSFHTARAYLATQHIATAGKYKEAFQLAVNLRGMRFSILMDLKKHANIENLDLLKTYVDLNQMEAEIQDKLQLKMTARYYFETAYQELKKLTRENYANYDNILYRYAEVILSQHRETEQEAFNIYLELESNQHLPAQITVAIAHLKGLLGQPVNVPEALTRFNQILPRIIEDHNILALNTIIYELLTLHDVDANATPEINRIFYSLLTSHDNLIKRKEVEAMALCMKRSVNPEYKSKAGEILKSIWTSNVEKLKKLEDSYVEPEEIIQLGNQSFAKKEYSQALSQYESAVAHHTKNAKVFHRIGYILTFCENYITPDPDKAEIYFKKAMELGSTDATHDLGSLYLRQKNLTKGKELVQTALDNGLNHSMAIFNLGKFHTESGSAKDEIIAMYYFQKAYAAGSQSAYRAIKSSGRATHNEIPRFEKAKDSISQLYNLGVTYNDMLIPSLAIPCFEAAAYAGDNLSIIELAKIYHSLGIEEYHNNSDDHNLAKACHYYEYACKNTNDRQIICTAAEFLELYKMILPALELLEYAASLHSEIAAAKLGDMYAYGKHVAKDNLKACDLSEQIALINKGVITEYLLSAPKKTPYAYLVLLDIYAENKNAIEIKKIKEEILKKPRNDEWNFYQNYIAIFSSLFNDEISNQTAIEYYASLRTDEANHIARIALQIARLYIKKGQFKNASTQYKIAFKSAESLFGLRQIILNELSEIDKNNKQILIKLRTELYFLEAKIQFKANHKIIANYFIEKIVSTYNDFFNAEVPAEILLFYAHILKEEKESETTAFNYFRKLSDDGMLEAKMNVACAYLKGLMGQKVNLNEAFNEFEALIKLALDDNDIEILNTIINKLISFHHVDPVSTKRINAIFYQIAMTNKLQPDSKSLENLAKCLSRSSNSDYYNKAIALLKPTMVFRTADLFNDGAILRMLEEYKLQNKMDCVLLLMSMLVIITANLPEQKKYTEEFKNLAKNISSPIKAFLHSFLFASTSPYCLLNLKTNSGITDPMVLIVAALQVATAAEGSINLGDPELIELNRLIELNFKLILQEKLDIRLEIADEVYAARKLEMENFMRGVSLAPVTAAVKKETSYAIVESKSVADGKSNLLCNSLFSHIVDLSNSTAYQNALDERFKL